MHSGIRYITAAEMNFHKTRARLLRARTQDAVFAYLLARLQRLADGPAWFTLQRFLP